MEVLGIAEKGLFYLAGATQMVSLWIFITSRQPVFVAAMAVSFLARLIREPSLSLTPFPRFQISLSLLCMCVCVCMCFGLKPSRSGFYFFYLSYLVTEKMINILTKVEIILCFALLLHFLIFFTVYLIVFACDFWIGIRTSLYYLHFSFINQRKLEILSCGFSCSCSTGKRRKKGKKEKKELLVLTPFVWIVKLDKYQNFK